MHELRDEYYNYLHHELGFSKRKINNAWKLVQKDFPHYDLTITEIVARDVLRDRKSYEENRDKIKARNRSF